MRNKARYLLECFPVLFFWVFAKYRPISSNIWVWNEQRICSGFKKWLFLVIYVIKVSGLFLRAYKFPPLACYWLRPRQWRHVFAESPSNGCRRYASLPIATAAVTLSLRPTMMTIRDSPHPSATLDPSALTSTSLLLYDVIPFSGSTLANRDHIACALWRIARKRVTMFFPSKFFNRSTHIARLWINMLRWCLRKLLWY